MRSIVEDVKTVSYSKDNDGTPRIINEFQSARLYKLYEKKYKAIPSQPPHKDHSQEGKMSRNMQDHSLDMHDDTGVTNAYRSCNSSNCIRISLDQEIESKESSLDSNSSSTAVIIQHELGLFTYIYARYNKNI